MATTVPLALTVGIPIGPLAAGRMPLAAGRIPLVAGRIGSMSMHLAAGRTKPILGDGDGPHGKDGNGVEARCMQTHELRPRSQFS